jgi:hypothetical protein
MVTNELRRRAMGVPLNARSIFDQEGLLGRLS